MGPPPRIPLEGRRGESVGEKGGRSVFQRVKVGFFPTYLSYFFAFVALVSGHPRKGTRRCCCPGGGQVILILISKIFFMRT